MIFALKEDLMCCQMRSKSCKPRIDIKYPYLGNYSRFNFLLKSCHYSLDSFQFYYPRLIHYLCQDPKDLEQKFGEAQLA